MRISIYEDAEKYLADWFGAEDSLTLSSGYLAGQLVCQSLLEEGCKLFHLPNTHPALHVESRESKISNIQDLTTILNSRMQKSESSVLLLDSIDFHGNHYPDYDILHSFPLEKLILVVDDSHGFGVVGKDGKGSFEALSNLGAKELIVCGSLNKAFGLQVGAILATKKRITQIRHTPQFTGASPASPANIATFLEAKNLYRERLDSLRQNIELFKSLIEVDPFFEYNSGHPAFSLKNPKLADHLETENILITRFQYPTQATSPLTRLIINATHRQEDIEKLSEAIHSFPQTG
ncbi:aminotransferase class I/II-fold pyridoxal phosphate-dependent enzyme [Pelagicoccus sp. SDUM812002]|uniref:aminotransferase class I/II-fold pyridoxal phosphate-dependent enzyme n=1 Tax=Pelagicoccus sp. SDUM812002 TaxID=3041266 RepID=UPI00280E5827|nr:aminotransferase class I/II-fold pyridoxal phosphate-dependent enzyme [Pelagicoccus sp. SDUM812002]MDQ8185784.1 aminotransferase class I/II-fold pyridoxal phosphate-dependent enzyme [Pelagicoccus sp. SDUM812002]